LPAACGGGQNPRSCFTGQTGGQKFLSPKTPFLFACPLWDEPGKIFKVLRLPRSSRARATEIITPYPYSNLAYSLMEYIIKQEILSSYE